LERFGSDSIVYGVRQVKGLEFRDVAVVDFFCRGNGMDKKHVKMWKSLFATSSGLESYPSEVEVDLKVLYTAITRSCSRLVFIETVSTASALAFFGTLASLKLASPFVGIRSGFGGQDNDSLMGHHGDGDGGGTREALVAGEAAVGVSGEGLVVHAATASTPLHSVTSGMMLVDDWRCEGLSLAAMVSDCEDPIAACDLLRKAIKCFTRSRDAELVDKARNHLTAIEAMQLIIS
jgi:hypothetical protein